MTVTAQDVKVLRDRTGAGMMDCKKALVETDGDIEKAIKHLREKGIAKASAKAERETKEGAVFSYIHPGDKLGVLVEINCETDFVARTDDFKVFGRDIAMHVAATAPLAVRREELDSQAIEGEREIYKQQMLNEGKPEKIIDKIVDGKLEKYYSEVCLVEQGFVKNPDVSIDDLTKETIVKLGENISIRRFTRFLLGEQ